MIEKHDTEEVSIFCKHPDCYPALCRLPVLRDLLSLVERNTTIDTLLKWNAEQRSKAEKWAVAVHFKASDNNVRVPREPTHVRVLAKASGK